MKTTVKNENFSHEYEEILYFKCDNCRKNEIEDNRSQGRHKFCPQCGVEIIWETNISEINL